MATYELTIKGISLADLGQGVLELADRFQVDGSGSLAAPAAAPRPRGRPRKDALHPAAHSEAVGSDEAGTPSVHDSEAGEGLDRNQCGTSAGSGSEEPAPVEAAGSDAGGEGAASEPQPEAPSATPEATAAEAPAETEACGAEAEAVSEAASETVSAADAPAEITLADVLKVGRALSAKEGGKGMMAAKAIFDRHGIAKPGETPPEKFAAVLADLSAELGQ